MFSTPTLKSVANLSLFVHVNLKIKSELKFFDIYSKFSAKAREFLQFLAESGQTFNPGEPIQTVVALGLDKRGSKRWNSVMA